MKNHLTTQQVKFLRTAHRKIKNKRQADRIKAILARNDGFSYEEIAKILMLDDNTIRKYIKNFDKEGIIVSNKYIGRHGKLTKQQEQELTDHLREKVYPSAKEVVEYVTEEYAVMYKERGMIKLLQRLGFRFKKTKIIPGKTDKAKQGIFIKKYNKIKENLGKDDRIYFVDAAHPHHNTRPGYGWIYVGEEKEIRSNTGRERVNLNGAIALPDENNLEFEILVVEEPTINDEAMIRLMEDLKEKQPRGKIHIIQDNARYNYSYLMQTYVELNKERIEVHFLPAYSPNLNIIERLWKFYYKKVVQNEYYENIKLFRGATHTFFENAATVCKKELSTLLTDNFQVIGM